MSLCMDVLFSFVHCGLNSALTTAKQLFMIESNFGVHYTMRSAHTLQDVDLLSKDCDHGPTHTAPKQVPPMDRIVLGPTRGFDS